MEKVRRGQKVRRGTETISFAFALQVNEAYLLQSELRDRELKESCNYDLLRWLGTEYQVAVSLTVALQVKRDRAEGGTM